MIDFRQFDEKLQIVQSFFSHGMLQSFLAKLFVPWEKNLCTLSDLTEKLKLERKFLPNSLSSKPYRNTTIKLKRYTLSKISVSFCKIVPNTCTISKVNHIVLDIKPCLYSFSMSYIDSFLAGIRTKIFLHHISTKKDVYS